MDPAPSLFPSSEEEAARKRYDGIDLERAPERVWVKRGENWEIRASGEKLVAGLFLFLFTLMFAYQGVRAFLESEWFGAGVLVVAMLAAATVCAMTLFGQTVMRKSGAVLEIAVGIGGLQWKRQVKWGEVVSVGERDFRRVKLVALVLAGGGKVYAGRWIEQEQRDYVIAFLRRRLAERG